jgi:hypothetical protein
MCREYMLPFSPVLELHAELPAKVYINGSTTYSGLRTIPLRASGHPSRPISGAKRHKVLKTIAYKWYAKRQA